MDIDLFLVIGSVWGFFLFIFFLLFRTGPRELRQRFGVSPEYLCTSVNLFECVIDGAYERSPAQPIAARDSAPRLLLLATEPHV